MNVSLYPVYAVSFECKNPTTPSEKMTIQTGMRVFDLESLRAVYLAVEASVFGRVPHQSWSVKLIGLKAVFPDSPRKVHVTGFVRGDLLYKETALFTRRTHVLGGYFELRREIEDAFHHGVGTDLLTEEGQRELELIVDSLDQ